MKCCTKICVTFTTTIIIYGDSRGVFHFLVPQISNITSTSQPMLIPDIRIPIPQKDPRNSIEPVSCILVNGKQSPQIPGPPARSITVSPLRLGNLGPVRPAGLPESLNVRTAGSCSSRGPRGTQFWLELGLGPDESSPLVSDGVAA